MKIRDLRARRILDSRGIPTLEVRALLEDGSIGVGSAPSGASTGSHEAHELRDGGDAYQGRDVRRAIEGVNGTLRETRTARCRWTRGSWSWTAARTGRSWAATR